jgi:FtsZ-interacting cell division protein ZipA
VCEGVLIETGLFGMSKKPKLSITCEFYIISTSIIIIIIIIIIVIIIIININIIIIITIVFVKRCTRKPYQRADELSADSTDEEEAVTCNREQGNGRDKEKKRNKKKRGKWEQAKKYLKPKKKIKWKIPNLGPMAEPIPTKEALAHPKRTRGKYVHVIYVSDFRTLVSIVVCITQRVPSR